MLGCFSARGEADAGTRYPTLISDSNGNQIFIRCLGNNSSCRIQEIRDARAVDQANGRRTYVFTYDAGPTPHLMSISSVAGTGEDYQFSYDAQAVNCSRGGRRGRANV